MRILTVLVSFLFIFTLSTAVPGEARIVDKIIVIVNNEVITFSELEEKLNPIILRLLNEERQVSAELKKDALDELIKTRLVMQEAQRRGINVSDIQIENRVDRIIRDLQGNFLDASEFVDALTESGMTVDRLRAQYREQARTDLIQNYLYAQVLGPESVVDEDELRQEYHILHILCASEADARVALHNIERDVDFSIVATYESIDPRAEQGGDWGYVRLGSMPEELDIAMLSLREGEVSDIIHHSGGYSIIKLVGIRKLEADEIEEVELQALSDHMRILKIYSQIEKWQQELWDKSYVEIKDRF